MYLPPHFRQEDLATLHDAMRRARLVTLVTTGPEGMEAAHVPVLLEPGEGEFGTLYGHLARGNAQSRHDGAPALAVFTGPEAYVSPSWYPSKAEHGKAVPTWNYVAVHAYGTLEIFSEPERLRPLLEKLTARHEAAMPHPWTLADAPEDFLAAQFKGIVGFRLPIARLEGKWKLSQNRSAEDRAGVAAGLAEAGEGEVAELMGKGLSIEN